MGTSVTVWLIVTGLVFVVWAFMMFRMLWIIAQRKKGLLSGGGVSDQFSAFFGFFKDPDHRRFRNRLILLTLVMVAIIAIGPMILNAAL